MLLRSLVRRRADPAVLGDAEGVVSDVARMTDLVEELLIAADPGQDWQRRSVDLVALTTDLLSSAEDHARSRGVTIEMVRRGTPEVRTHGNDVALRRAVLALVDNAIEHTPPEGLVRLTLEAQSGVATIEVCDTGTGIDPARRTACSTASAPAPRRRTGAATAWAWPWPAMWSPVTAAGCA